MVVPDDAQPGERERLCAVALGEDERAALAVARARLVGVRQLGDAYFLGVFIIVGCVWVRLWGVWGACVCVWCICVCLKRGRAARSRSSKSARESLLPMGGASAARSRWVPTPAPRTREEVVGIDDHRP